MLSLLSAIAGQASTLDLRPVELPLQIRNLGLQLIQADKDQYIATGGSVGGSCLVAILDKDLSLVTLRHISVSSSRAVACGFASIDSVGDIVVFGRSSDPDILGATDRYPQSGVSNFLLKLSRPSLEVKSSIRFGLGSVLAVTVAPDDSIWLGGYVTTGLPTTPDAIQREYPGPFIISPRDRAGFLVRFSPDGQRLLYSTYLGSTRAAVATITTDHEGNVYAAGSGIWKFSPAACLIWSTYLPSASTLDSAIGPNGDLYLVGTTEGGEFYTTPNALQSTSLSPFGDFLGNLRGYPAASVDGFAARFSPAGQLLYSTLMGGSRADSLRDVIVESDGSALVSGSSSGNLFPTRSAVAMGPGTVLAKLSPNGTGVSFSTYTFPGLFNPVRLTEGGYVMLSYSSIGSILETSAFRVTELPDALPRIDAVVGSAQPSNALTAGTNATISGEGFSVVMEVTVGELPARIVSQSDCLIEIEIPPNLPGVTPQTNFTGDVRLLRDGEVLRQIRIQVFAPFLP